MRFIQSKVDECVYTNDSIMCMVYSNDGIIITKKGSLIDQVIAQIKKMYKLTDKG